MKKTGTIEFTVTERSAERVISEMPVRDGVKNPYGVVQAGAMLWLADVTATILAMGAADPSPGMTGFPLAITLNANFLANQSEGTLRAVSTFVKRGRSVTVVRTIVYGAGDKIVADVTTTHVPAR